MDRGVQEVSKVVCKCYTPNVKEKKDKSSSGKTCLVDATDWTDLSCGLIDTLHLKGQEGKTPHKDILDGFAATYLLPLRYLCLWGSRQFHS